jgi:hypothetical protein
MMGDDWMLDFYVTDTGHRMIVDKPPKAKVDFSNFF